MRVAPDLVSELRASQYALGVGSQDREEVELRHGQWDLVVAQLQAARSVVDLQGADREQAFASATRLGQRGAPKVGVDACGEDPRVEGLGNVIVGADLEPDDLVHLG